MNGSEAAKDIAFQRVVIDPEHQHYQRAIGDIDGDGNNEIVATSPPTADGGAGGLVWCRHPDWSVQPLVSFDDSADGYAFWRADDLRLADVNGDGWLDIVGGLGNNPKSGSRLVWWENPGPPDPGRTFTEP